MPFAAVTNPVPAVEAPAKISASKRLMSVDALRGFDMFWIIGADALVRALKNMSPNFVTTTLATQLEHVEWAGLHFYDLIFPLFVFIVGVSLVFSLRRARQEEGRAGALRRVFRRSLLLFALALFYSGGLTDPWPNIRLLGVLNRIALCYFFAGLIFCFFNPRAMAAICAGLLVGYWALMTFVPIRDIQLENEHLARLAADTGDLKTAALFKGTTNLSTLKNSPGWAAAQKMFDGTTKTVTGKFEKGLNLANHLDFQFLPGKKWDVFWDPEGLLSTLPAIATCLLGVFAGLLLMNPNVADERKVAILFGAGAIAIATGLLWSMQFPIVKKIWSSSFVLVAGGCSALLLAGFFLVVDVWQKRTWCQPFVWIGMNSITIYVASNLLGGFRRVGARLAGGDLKNGLETFAPGAGELLVAIVGLALAFAFVHFLYRRKIFLRL
jgi:predicted acyltransferase